MHISSKLRTALTATIFVTLVPIYGLARIALERDLLAGRTILPSETYSLPPAAVLRATSVGYNETVADLLWVRSIAYYTDHLTTDHDLRYLRRHLDNIIALDPYARHVYRYGASMLVMQGERTTNDHVFAAINLLKKAHQLWPDDWHFPLYIGVYYLNDLRSPSKKQRGKWRLEGADWIHRATLVGASEPWLPTLAAKVYNEQGKRDVAILRLQELYLTAQTEQMKLNIAGKLRELKAVHVAEELKQTSTSLRELHAGSGLPFVSPDLFVLVGLPPLDPFSLQGLVERHPPGLLR